MDPPLCKTLCSLQPCSGPCSRESWVEICEQQQICFKMSRTKEWCQQFTLYQPQRNTEQVSLLGARRPSHGWTGLAGGRYQGSGAPLGPTAPWSSGLYGVLGPRLGRHPPGGCVQAGLLLVLMPTSGLTTERVGGGVGVRGWVLG